MENLMSDTWKDIQDVKNKKSALRERLKNRRRQAEDLLTGLATGQRGPDMKRIKSSSDLISDASISTDPTVITSLDTPSPSSMDVTVAALQETSTVLQETVATGKGSVSPRLSTPLGPLSSSNSSSSLIIPVEELERRLLKLLERLGVSMDLPIAAKTLQDCLVRELKTPVDADRVQDLLAKFSIQKLIVLENSEENGKSEPILITNVDHAKDTEKEPSNKTEQKSPQKTAPGENFEDDIENLLGTQTAKERETKRVNEEILQLLDQPTSKEKSVMERFRSQGGSQVQQFCPFGTREECTRQKKFKEVCDKLHFRKIIQSHTDESLGDCSFLNTCFHIETCKYVHYEIEQSSASAKQALEQTTPLLPRNLLGLNTLDAMLYPPQWIECDVRKLDMKVLGKFAVLMADPPWDIHMELPYGTMSDDEMKKLDIPCVQDEGYIFLWVTGRAMELGRECLKQWGYDRCDEIIWVKTNQLQRIIRTGRTGHWFNHGKEHCLVGVKGDPKRFNKGLDCDVIVSEVRETSHKPDEIYGIIERLSPGMRKLELFGRPHNVQPNWITLGNQLEGTRLVDPEVVDRFKKRYPNGFDSATNTERKA